MNIKTLTIIGNGFDLGHDLPTRFDNFINSNPALYKSKYDIFCNGKNSWNDIENKYQKLLCHVMEQRSWLDITEEVEQIIRDYGFTEYGEVDYYGYVSEAWDDEINNITNLIQLLEEFEQDFQNYLKVACNDKAILDAKPRYNISEILHRSDTIISFNYTHTVELLYGIENIFHIHGDVDDCIAIGCGTLDRIKESLIDAEYPTMKKFTPDKHGLSEMMFYYEEDMDGNRVENHFIKGFFDDVVASVEDKESEIFSLLDRKSKDSLSFRKKIINMLKGQHYDKVYIIGHSIGNADFSVFDAINKDAIVTCSYFDENDFVDKDDALRKLQLEHQYIRDSELYQYNYEEIRET